MKDNKTYPRDIETTIRRYTLSDEYVNDITRCMDEYIIDKPEEQSWWKDGDYAPKTYMCDVKLKRPQGNYGDYIIGIRKPGSTRGHIRVDCEYKILEIVIYKDYISGEHIPNTAAGYELEVREAVKKFIGSTIKVVEL